MIQSNKMTFYLKQWLVLLAAGAVWSGQAATYYVSTNGDDAAAGTAWATALRTISNAVVKAQTNTLNDVLVSNGVYNLSVSINITNGIAVHAFYPNTSATVVNGMGATRCFSLSHANALVAGFTISNGWVSDSGGGVQLTSGTLSNCVINGNAASNYGGGIYINGTGLVENCVIIANSATNSGGGIALYNAVPSTNGIMRNCLVASNVTISIVSSQGRGGGIYLNGGLVDNCRISYNTSPTYGGAIYFVGSYPSYLRSCLLTHNFAPQGGAIIMYGNSFVDNCTIASNWANVSAGGVFNRGTPITLEPTGGQFMNCIIWLNSLNSGTTSNYYDVNGGGYYTNCCIAPIPVYGTNNFTDDPLFAAKDTSDFHLQRNSRCINTGLNQNWMEGTTDLDDHRRIDRFLGIVDIGAYEFVPSGTMFTF